MASVTVNLTGYAEELVRLSNGARVSWLPMSVSIRNYL